MLDYLKSLKRNDLIKLYANFGTNSEIKKNPIRNKNDIIVNALVEEQVLTKDVAIDFLLKKDNKEIVQAENTAKVISNPVSEVVTVQSKSESPDVIISKQITSQEQQLRELATKMKQEAMETLVVTITPTSESYLKDKKNGETIFFSNQFFSLAKLVPFNVKCELPRCIVEIAMEAVTPVYTSFDDIDTRKRTGRLGVYQLTPKYNVIIHGTAEEIKISEDNKRKLGLK